MEKNKGTIKRYCIKFRRMNEPRWRMEPIFGTKPKTMKKQLELEIVKHGILTLGSYELAIKSPRGAMVTQWTGTPKKAIDYFIQYVKPKK